MSMVASGPYTERIELLGVSVSAAKSERLGHAVRLSQDYPCVATDAEFGLLKFSAVLIASEDNVAAPAKIDFLRVAIDGGERAAADCVKTICGGVTEDVVVHPDSKFTQVHVEIAAGLREHAPARSTDPWSLVCADSANELHRAAGEDQRPHFR